MLLIAEDINIHLERPRDTDSQKFDQLIRAFSLRQLVQESTHDHSGLLDVMIALDDGAPDNVTVVESGLSDHKLLHWSLPVACPRPVYLKIFRRGWKHLRLDQFIECLELSPLCLPTDPSNTVTDLALRYQTVLTSILDDLTPVTELSLCSWLHRPFYDGDCRRARWLERAYYKKKGTSAKLDALSSWHTA